MDDSEDELDFAAIWPRGYYEGDPLDPLAKSTHGMLGYMSILHVTYLACIKPWIDAQTRVLEIGPGRGAWTRAIQSCGPKHIAAVDVVPPDITGFWQHIGQADNIDYIVADDCSLRDVPARSVDYVFSFGVFCHLRPEQTEEYVGALADRMTEGAHGFLMIPDRRKFEACRARTAELSVERMLADGRRLRPARAAYRFAAWRDPHLFNIPTFEDLENEDGRWFDLGTDRAVGLLEQAGFTVIDRDMGVTHRDPVIHFRR